jgi:hypothetical protein
VRPVDERSERVAGSAVDIACLQADDRRGVQFRQLARGDAPLVFGAQPHGPAAPKPDEAQGFENRGMDLITDHHLDRGRAYQPESGSVPADSRQHSVPARRQARRVCHRRSGDETA